jgi:hypothetical protein
MDDYYITTIIHKYEADLQKVKKYGYALQFIKEQTYELCLEAVKTSGCACALKYVKEQTPEICLASVKNSGCALEYVKEQTPELCWEAVKEHGWALQYVANSLIKAQIKLELQL